ncbi:MAG: TetR family transcriptional regulator [Synergistota bacterium]|nr:TetR family transcriptional regulator [Synergistota bacterium]
MTMDSSRDVLIEAGKELFSTKGYMGTSVREIARAAGTNVSMISYYFGGKEGLYREILGGLVSEVKGLFDDPSVGLSSPMDRVAHYARSVSRVHDENPCLARILHHEMNSPSPMLEELQREVFPRVFGFLVKAFKDGIDQGVFRGDVDPKVMSYCLASMVNFYRFQRDLVRSFSPNLVEEGSDFAEKVLKVFFRGVMA